MLIKQFIDDIIITITHFPQGLEPVDRGIFYLYRGRSHTTRLLWFTDNTFYILGIPSLLLQ